MPKDQQKRWEEMSKSDMSLAQVIEDYVADLKIQRKSPKTIDFYLKNLRLFLKWLKQRGYKGSLEDLNLQTVKKYIFYLEEEHHKYNGHPSIPESTESLSLYSVQGHVRTLKALSSWLQSEEYLTDNVLARLKLPKAPKMEIKVLTDGEIKALLSGVNPNISSGARNYAILLLMLDSGLRLGEVVGLKVHKIDIERGQLWVNGKGNKERIVPIGDRCRRYLRRYMVHFRPEPIRPQIDNAFLNLDGTPMTDNSIKLMFTRLSKKCKIPRLHAHLCRHTFGTNYLRNGGDVFSLQKILGHEDLATVKMYMHLVDADVVQKHKLYSPMDRLDLPRPNRRNR
jgi:integrase/recombinase XerC